MAAARASPCSLQVKGGKTWLEALALRMGRRALQQDGKESPSDEEALAAGLKLLSTTMMAAVFDEPPGLQPGDPPVEVDLVPRLLLQLSRSGKTADSATLLLLVRWAGHMQSAWVGIGCKRSRLGASWRAVPHT